MIIITSVDSDKDIMKFEDKWAFGKFLKAVGIEPVTINGRDIILYKMGCYVDTVKITEEE